MKIFGMCQGISGMSSFIIHFNICAIKQGIKNIFQIFKLFSIDCVYMTTVIAVLLGGGAWSRVHYFVHLVD